MNRELIYGGLFKQLAGIEGFAVTSRLLKHWADAPIQPALYQAGSKESAITNTGQPTKWELRLSVYLYVKTEGAESPGEVMNPLLDAVCAVVNKRHPITGRNDLGGIAGVEWARIDGTIETDEGTLGNQAVAIIPVLILATE